jgi:hypothetical protein
VAAVASFRLRRAITQCSMRADRVSFGSRLDWLPRQILSPPRQVDLDMDGHPVKTDSLDKPASS